jgi:hypothetical protein
VLKFSPTFPGLHSAKQLRIWESFACTTKKARNRILDPIIIPIYFNGYLPMNTNISTIAKIKAVVEKLAGKMRINVKNTNQSSHNEALK